MKMRKTTPCVAPRSEAAATGIREWKSAVVLLAFGHNVVRVYVVGVLQSSRKIDVSNATGIAADAAAAVAAAKH